MKIRKDFEMALQILEMLQTVTFTVRSEDVAYELGFSLNLTEQVMRKLRIAGYVEAHRGPNGGFSLTSKEQNAFEVAKAIGAYKEPKNALDPNSPQARLLEAVKSAYINTRI